MNAFYYLLEANGYLLVFYVFYRLVLQKETFYGLNRFYLLITTALSFIMPSFRLSGMRQEQAVGIVYESVRETGKQVTFWDALLAVYMLAALFFLLRFFLRLYRISMLIRSSRISSLEGIKTVEIADSNLSFSFMNYLFINPAAKRAETIIRHEQVHIRQFHSLDILFFEFLQVMNWFNPLIHIIQQELKAIHEFIADEETSRSENSARDYAMFLIHNSCGATPAGLESTMFSQSLLKKRIMKLNQKKSSGWARLKYAPVVMLLPLMLCATAMAFTKTYGFVDLMPVNSKAMAVLPPVIQDTVTKKSVPVKKYSVPPPPPPSAPVKASKKRNIAPPPSPMEPKSVVEERVISPAPPPPPVERVKVDKVRFPAPKVKPSKEKMVTPPKPKVDQIKFPPPVVKSKAPKKAKEIEEVIIEEPVSKSKAKPSQH